MSQQTMYSNMLIPQYIEDLIKSELASFKMSFKSDPQNFNLQNRVEHYEQVLRTFNIFLQIREALDKQDFKKASELNEKFAKLVEVKERAIKCVITLKDGEEYKHTSHFDLIGFDIVATSK